MLNRNLSFFCFLILTFTFANPGRHVKHHRKNYKFLRHARENHHLAARDQEETTFLNENNLKKSIFKLKGGDSITRISNTSEVRKNPFKTIIKQIKEVENFYFASSTEISEVDQVIDQQVFKYVIPDNSTMVKQVPHGNQVNSSQFGSNLANSNTYNNAPVTNQNSSAYYVQPNGQMSASSYGNPNLNSNSQTSYVNPAYSNSYGNPAVSNPVSNMYGNPGPNWNTLNKSEVVNPNSNTYNNPEGVNSNRNSFSDQQVLNPNTYNNPADMNRNPNTYTNPAVSNPVSNTYGNPGPNLNTLNKSEVVNPNSNTYNNPEGVNSNRNTFSNQQVLNPNTYNNPADMNRNPNTYINPSVVYNNSNAFNNSTGVNPNIHAYNNSAAISYNVKANSNSYSENTDPNTYGNPAAANLKSNTVYDTSDSDISSSSIPYTNNFDYENTGQKLNSNTVYDTSGSDISSSSIPYTNNFDYENQWDKSNKEDATENSTDSLELETTQSTIGKNPGEDLKDSELLKGTSPTPDDSSDQTEYDNLQMVPQNTISVIKELKEIIIVDEITEKDVNNTSQKADEDISGILKKFSNKFRKRQLDEVDIPENSVASNSDRYGGFNKKRNTIESPFKNGGKDMQDDNTDDIPKNRLIKSEINQMEPQYDY
ncbi:hypothetical protein JTE90_002389 [Oedothorax gibbosus]|uniref:GATA zinc finger domain-containing protein 14-like n=1 Tax=Oedothorax gibbosus TaxID=931172 RepID=A0AAV6VBZ0_9ARAC|nr:hypothetical protein JTE90_002389 [Oedothorax gibbosus]